MKKNLKQLLIIFIVAIFAIYLLNTISNGAVRTILYELFFIESNFEAGTTQYSLATPHWDNIYLFIIITTLIVVSLFVILLNYKSTKNINAFQKELIGKLETALHAFRDKKDYTNELKEFGMLEALLLQIRGREEEQIALIEKQIRQKNDLISYLAHDMKTPLASVIGYLNLLNDVHDIPKEQNDAYIQITLDKANRLESLIDEFFDITRFNLHDIVISRGKIELSFLFKQLVEQFYPILRKEQKEIELCMQEDIVYYGDADKLARAFNNILKNAISYSYANTKIVVEVKQEKDYLCIQFHNQGDEIPAQKLQLIFEKFYRLDKARSSYSGGAGLGLAIAKEIITAHEGQIYAESSLKETVFIVMLPLPTIEQSAS